MLKPAPAVLRGLLSRYADAQITLIREDSPAVRLKLENVSFTLCVATATTNIQDALVAADAMLAAPSPAPGVVPAPAVRSRAAKPAAV
ncbi:DUF5133 domain-containing protein [Streptomyces sp. NPDC058655]|uniref:DUF5133 domain-containing protein n=1 Tax=Streptomyces sp. NPDC058655 TaxID=3346577 RepID=UPI00365924BB